MIKIEHIIDYNIIANLCINNKNEIWFIKPFKFLNNQIQYEYIKGIYKDILVVTDDLNKPIVFKDKVFLDNWFLKFRVSNIKDNILFYYNKEKERRYGIYDLEKDIIKFETTEYIDEILFFNSIYTEFNNKIISREIEKGKILWQYDLSSLPKWKKYENEILPSSVEQFLGIYEGVLWLQLNGYRLLALDVQTGEQIHYIENSGLYINLYLNQKTGKIIELASKSYEEFDLKSLKMTKSIELEKDFNIRKCTYYEDDTKIYFVGKYKEERKNNCYGIFDVEKEQILWYRLSEGEEEYFNPPQANDKIIGILDSNNTLTVYEKNEIVE